MKITLNFWSGQENSSNLNPIKNLWSICKQRQWTVPQVPLYLKYNGLYLKGKADSGSNLSVVQGPPNLERLFKIGRLNA